MYLSFYGFGIQYKRGSDIGFRVKANVDNADAWHYFMCHLFDETNSEAMRTYDGYVCKTSSVGTTAHCSCKAVTLQMAAGWDRMGLFLWQFVHSASDSTKY